MGKKKRKTLYFVGKTCQKIKEKFLQCLPVKSGTEVWKQHTALWRKLDKVLTELFPIKGKSIA